MRFRAIALLAFSIAWTPFASIGALAAPKNTIALFSINIHEHGHAKLSRETVQRIMEIHRRYEIPLDLYLNDTIVQEYRQIWPELPTIVKASPKLFTISYHIRPPFPYAHEFDWLGLEKLSKEERRKTILKYETHRIDLITSKPASGQGGFVGLKEWAGDTPWVAAAPIRSPLISASLDSVFRELGARFVIVHGRATPIGTKRNGLWIRPEHFDFKSYEGRSENPSADIASALAQARTNAGNEPTAVLGVKVHENDFISQGPSWAANYMKRPGPQPPQPPYLPKNALAPLKPAPARKLL